MRLHFDIREHERNAGSRVRKMGARTATKFTLALDRFVGDLLRARTGTNTTGRIYRPTGKGDFSDAPVKYDMFMRVLDGLKALGLVEHRKGRTRYVETGFAARVTVPGRAARFWATTKLLELAQDQGINSDNVDDQLLDVTFELLRLCRALVFDPASLLFALTATSRVIFQHQRVRRRFRKEVIIDVVAVDAVVLSEL